MTLGFQSPPANARAPSGHGTFPVPEGRRVYAVGDIHGRADLLARLHKKIAADALDIPGFQNIVVYLGDYVDRGPDSSGVLDMLINRPLEGFEAHHLKGNHEDMMIQFLETGANSEMWIMMNGARDTMESYGIGYSDFARHESDMKGLARDFANAVPESHRAFLDALKMHHCEGDVLFVHAGIAPGVPVENQSPHDLMWIRGEFTESNTDHGLFVVHGHSNRPAPEIRSNRLGIDTGAWFSGTLTAAVLEGGDIRFLQT